MSQTFTDQDGTKRLRGTLGSLTVVRVGFADIVDRLSDGDGWAALVGVDDGVVVSVLGVNTSEAFNDAQAAFASVQIQTTDSVQAMQGAINPLTQVTADTSGVVDIANNSDPGLPYLMNGAATVWLHVSPWDGDGTAGIVDVYLHIDARA